MENELIEGQVLKKMSKAVAKRTRLEDVFNAAAPYNPQAIAAYLIDIYYHYTVILLALLNDTK